MEKYKIIHFNSFMDSDNIREKLGVYKENDTVIFMKEGCVCNIPDLGKIMEKIDILLQNYDIFYLSNVMDSCNNNLNIIEEFEGLKIYPAKSPNGFYCIAGKKKNWKKILTLLHDINFESISSGLNSLVINKQISALTSWPRVYNPGNNYDFYPCRQETILSKKDNPEYQMSVYYFMVSCFILTIFLSTFHKYN